MATRFDELQTMILEVFKRTDKTTEIKRAINDTYKEMVGIIDPRKLQDQIYKTLVMNREEYPIPDTVLRINHPVRLLEAGSSNRTSMSYPLNYLTKDEYDEIEPNPNALTIYGGRPWAYTFWKNSILVTDIPDRNNTYQLEINIGGEATVLVEASDQVIFSPTWDETIKAGALARLYLGIQFKDSASDWQSIYRWGFAGNERNITGGLELLRKLERDLTRAPIIVDNRDF